jgi:hypothetical protein
MRRALLRLQQAAEPRGAPGVAALAQALGFGTERAAAQQPHRAGSPEAADSDERPAPDEPPGLPSPRASLRWARAGEREQGFAAVTAVRNLLAAKGAPDAAAASMKGRVGASGRQLGPKASRAVAPQARRGAARDRPRP